jgi:putative transposase
MGRRPRPVDDGLVFHPLNRGNNRADIFADDGDRQAILDALAKTKERYPFPLFGYCLMTNHFHMLFRPDARQSVGRIMQSPTIAHTARYHKRWQTVGHVWQGRFKSPVIQDDGHLLTVLRFIKANPLRARMVKDLAAYRWSSFPAHGWGVADPLLDPFPEYDALGHTPPNAARAGAAKSWPRSRNPTSRASANRSAPASRSASPIGSPATRLGSGSISIPGLKGGRGRSKRERLVRTHEGWIARRCRLDSMV